MIHTTIGIYPNGDIKSNGVSSEKLAAHIMYNLDLRLGRAFIVDGCVLNYGGCNKRTIDNWNADNILVHDKESDVFV